MKKPHLIVALGAVLGACLLGACSGGSSTPPPAPSGAVAKSAPAAPAPTRAEPQAVPRTSPQEPKPAEKAAEKSAVQPLEKPAVTLAEPPVQPPAETPAEKPAAQPAQTPPAPAGGGGAAPAPLAPPSGDAPLVYVLMKTSMGEIVLELDREKAPKSVENFLSYVDSRFYHGTVFHRIMADFMVQGGGFDTAGQQKPTQPPVVNEWRNGLKNVRGSIAMARLGGKPDSATSQFFISVVDNPALDMARDGAAYAVFGRVYAGMGVVDAIRQAPVEASERGELSKPIDPVVIEEVRQITVQQAMNRAELEKQMK